MGQVKGVLTIVLLTINSAMVCVPLLIIVPIKLISPTALRQYWDRLLDRIVIDGWVGANRYVFRILKLMSVDVHWRGDAELSRDQWYMVISNHQSWTDILVLQTSLFERIPPIKFFTKRQLIWVPFVGVAMWLLGFPYVRRDSRAQAAKRVVKGRKSDRQATIDACERFRAHPTTVLNFLEGTRFTPEKHARQPARYNHLLNPKIGGLSYVMGGMNTRLHKLIDITIYYPHGTPTFWEFVQGNCPGVTLQVDCHDIPEHLRGTANDSQQRKLLAPWIDDLWRSKDQRIAAAKVA